MSEEKSPLADLVSGQISLQSELDRIFNIFSKTKALIRPHFILTGASGTGKTLIITSLCEKHNVGFLEINAASLTKEGTSGNSLSKALGPLINLGNKPTVVFVDEFDKLFISGNSNSSSAHETTTGVQNEFLKVLESDSTQVYGDYGKYVDASTKNCLFIFAGAFNNEENITIDRLREIGIKTEFIGRVGLIFNTTKLTLEELYAILENSPLLNNYCRFIKGAQDKKQETIGVIKEYLKNNYELNSLGARVINTLIHSYYINNGKLEKEAIDDIMFHSAIEL